MCIFPYRRNSIITIDRFGGWLVIPCKTTNEVAAPQTLHSDLALYSEVEVLWEEELSIHRSQRNDSPSP